MDARLATLIGHYHARVAEAVTMLEGAGIARPATAGEWAASEIPARGQLPRGFSYEKQETGCTVKGPGLYLEFVFGENGQIDGFDPARAYEFARRRFGCYGFTSQAEMLSAVQRAAEAGELTGPGPLYYVDTTRQQALPRPAVAPPSDNAPAAERPVLPDARRRIIAWWQIVFGALGAILMTIGLVFGRDGPTQVLGAVTGETNVVFGYLFFGASIRFGQLLLRGERDGMLGSAWCQGLQVLSFAFVGGPHYEVRAGPSIGLTVGDDTFTAGVGAAFSFFLGTRISGPAWELSINFLALAWTVMLVRAARTSSDPIGDAVPAAEPTG